MSLPNPSNEFVKKINGMFYTYILDSSKKLKKEDVIQKNCGERCRKMISFNAFMLSIKCTMVRGLYKTMHGKKIFLSNVDTTTFNCYDDDYIRKIRDKCTNKFWCDVLYRWLFSIKK